ncbi:MAG: fibronectin type III domain-containing protein [Candidatus Colwellbacteria bacterium]|nr:fibronectin type III domain-containing protein [Candidatus Colwellbacteria bacterium]
MNKVLSKRSISLALLALVVTTTQAPLAFGAASFNNDPQDLKTLRVSNYTRFSDSNINWENNSVAASLGEVFSVRLYYHNTALETANNVRIKINPVITSGSLITVTGQLSADNAGTITDTVQVNVSGGGVTGVTHIATFWYPDSPSVAKSLPSGQSGAEVTGSGANIGSVAQGWATQGFLVARFRIQPSTVTVTPSGNTPSVNTLSATDIERTSARLRGEANPRGDSTEAWFEWGTSSSNLSRETSHQSMGSGNSFVSFSNFVSGLEPNTDYFYRAVARNSFGTARGDIRSFTTGRAAVDRPQVRILPATNITSFSALCRAEVDPNGSATTAFFEWGTDSNNLLNRTGNISLGSGNSFVNISSFLTGLNSNTTYYCRIVADNSAGRSTSGLESFRTTGVVTSPPVITKVIKVFEREATVPAEQVIKLKLEADKSELSEDKVTYIVTWENLTKRTLRDASIEVRLPEELEFDDASRSVDEIRDNTLVFRLGTIRGGERGEIEIETSVEELEAGDVITTTATLSYIDTNNVRYIVAVEDKSEITAEDLAGGGLTATILDALRDFFTNPIFWILIALLLLYLIYRFLTARREPPMYPPTGGGPTVVAYPPAGSPGAQMYSAPPPAPPRAPEPPPFG